MTHHPYDDIDHTMILAMRRGCSLADSALLAHFTRGPSRASHLRDALKYADMIAEAAKVLRDEMARADAGEAAAKRARETLEGAI